jgi:hypothetical protein
LANKDLPQPDGLDITEEDEMTPYIVLPKHEPVPMALVSREPNGSEYSLMDYKIRTLKV